MINAFVKGSDAGQLHQVVGFQLALASVAADAIFAAHVGAPLALSRAEFTLLMMVSEAPGISPAHLARALRLARPKVTLLIDRLVERRWVVREQNQKDGRGLHLHTSAKGSASAKKALATLLAAERQAFHTLSAVEQMMLAELLQKLAKVHA